MRKKLLSLFFMLIVVALSSCSDTAVSCSLDYLVNNSSLRCWEVKDSSGSVEYIQETDEGIQDVVEYHNSLNNQVSIRSVKCN